MKLIKICVFLFAVALQGCVSSIPVKQQLAESVLFHTVGIGLRHGEGSCRLLASSCGIRDNYSEWQDENGDVHCSCKSD
jgi:hypothetical protein